MPYIYIVFRLKPFSVLSFVGFDLSVLVPLFHHCVKLAKKCLSLGSSV